MAMASGSTSFDSRMCGYLFKPFRRVWFTLRENTRIAGAQLLAHQMRSLLSALGISTAIVAVTLMGIAIKGIDAGLDRSLRMLGDHVFYLEQAPWAPTEDFSTYKDRPDITIAMADRLDSMIANAPDSLLETAMAAPSSSQTITSGKRELTDVDLIGATDAYSRITPTNCSRGRFLNEIESRAGRNVCVIGSDVATGLFDGEDPIGKTIRIGEGGYRVIGVFAKQGTFLGLFSFDSDVVIPLNSYAKFFNTDADSASIRVKVKDGKKMTDAREELRADFRRIRRLLPDQPDDFTINEQSSLRSTLDPIKAGLATAGLFITGLALFVGGIGIMNVTFASVKERIPEIGIRKALGASTRTILLQFLIEAVCICLLGGAIGLAVALFWSSLAAFLFPAFPVVFAPDLAATALGISVTIGLVAGFAPAWQASRLDPVEALRYE